MKDPRTEQLLDSFADVVWDYRPTLRIDQIDLKQSRKNQARIHEPIRAEWVDELRIPLSQGLDLPAIVVFEDKPNKYIIIDGNHRTEAHVREGHKTLDAYVVLADDPADRQMLTFAFNPRDGHGPSDDDKAWQAVNLIAQGQDREQVATVLQMPVSRVDTALADYRGEERARKLSASSHYRKVPKTSRVHMHRSLRLDRVFAAAVTYVAKFEVSFKDTRALVSEINAFASEDEQLQAIKTAMSAAQKVLDRQKAEREAKKQGKIVRSSNTGLSPLNRYIGHMEYIVQKTNPTEIKTIITASTSQERERILGLIDKTEAAVTRMRNELMKYEQ